MLIEARREKSFKKVNFLLEIERIKMCNIDQYILLIIAQLHPDSF